MDNVCHTLVGAACARAGLARQTRFAAATSMIAANLPDLDVLVFATELPSVAFRRGWTHGVLAQAVLPAALAGVMLLAGRRLFRGAGNTASPAPAFVPLLVLSYVGVLSHVLLDLVNNYGVRLLTPFSWRWFYGDAIFIIDPWLWIAFGAAVLAGRKGWIRGTRIFLVIACFYIAAMTGSAAASRALVASAWEREHGTKPGALMAGPVAVDPFHKAVIIDAGDHYRSGTFSWIPVHTTLTADAVMKNDTHPAVAAARRDKRIAALLVWARFPFWEVEPVADGTRVTVRDMRFARLQRGGFSATTIVGARE